ncbi:solute carrier organic anion transporter family member 4C1 [Asbolus verrucosus]|uniref:Solute carrier organic anion transporter family member 4C1 n=1 Tax=Asbolus verrucosus TaxID=1661398 RepID=A0A482V9U3_ASBVE|nr:solute carrier organic anion transporter family member 4C1 [Asbolus verrucosus]
MSNGNNHLANGTMWTEEKQSNNNGPSNGNTRLGIDDIPEEQTALTNQNEVYRSQCFVSEGDFTDNSDTECGLGPFAPHWLQMFASKQAFLIVFCIAWVLQGMYHTYFVSAITTIEKLFQIQSKITGIIMSATEIGQIGSSLLLTYYGGQGHRPKWIAWGMVLFAVSSFTCSLPHFIYGRQLISANDLTGITKDPNVCKIPSSLDLDPANTHSWGNSSTHEHIFTTTSVPNILQTCQEELDTDHRIQPSVTKIVLAIFFISLLGVGMGQTAVYTLGIPYIDDNVASKESPLYFDFPKTVKRLLKNDILMFRTASSVLHILPIAGLYTFLPKYLESQFRLPTPSANMISGVGGILVMGVGIIISGVFILRVKPNARFVAAWIAFTAIIYALGMGILMFIGCPMDDLAGIQTRNEFATFDLNCNKSTCECNKYKFAPICGQDGKTYLSPCHAGCRNYTEKEGKIVEYSDCLCVSNEIDNISVTISDSVFYGNATIGYCDVKCPNFTWYIILFSIFVFIHSTSEVGSMLLILRCVDPRDKAMALGLIQFAIGLFGNVPCPIVYGAVVDSACLVWKMACGEKGACGLYDSNIFRMFYHGEMRNVIIDENVVYVCCRDNGGHFIVRILRRRDSVV